MSASPDQLPPGWARATLGDALPIVYGKGLTEGRRNAGGNVPVFGSSGAVGRHDDALTTGPTLIVGRKGNVGAVFFSPVACWPIDTVYYASAASDLDLQYFAYLLQDVDLGRLDRSTAVPGLSRDDYNRVEVPIAPLPEQRRIVAALESHLSRLDAARAALERAQRNLERYRASVLHAAVTGRLVPTEAELARAESRDYEPAFALLQRILAERRRRWEEAELAKMVAKGKPPTDERWKARYKEPVAADAEGLGELPEGWCWGTVDQVARVASGQTPAGVAQRLRPHGAVPWYRVSDMNTVANETIMRESEGSLSEADVDELGIHVQPQGAIIFPKRGGAIRTGKKRRLGQQSTYDLNTMGIVPESAIGDYIWTWFLQVDLWSLTDGSNVPQINHGDIESLLVPIPPVNEQSRITAEVDRLLSASKEVKGILDQDTARLSRLRQSILRMAFEGRLVDQDPADEPASVLLERIRAERAAEGAGRRRGGRGRGGRAGQERLL